MTENYTDKEQMVLDYMEMMDYGDDDRQTAIEELQSQGLLEQFETSEGSSFNPEGLLELKFYSGKGTSNFDKFNLKAKKLKREKDKFEIGNFYLGTNFPKIDSEDGKSKVIDFENVDCGLNLGGDIEFIITHNLYYGSRFIQAGSKLNFTTKKVDSIKKEIQNTTMTADISVQEGDKWVSKKNVPYKTLKEQDPDNVKMFNYLVGLIKVSDSEWKPFFTTFKFKKFEFDPCHNFREDLPKGAMKSKFKVKYEPEIDDDGYWNGLFKGVGEDGAYVPMSKEEFVEVKSQVIELNKLIPKFLKDQYKNVEKQETTEEESEEDEVEAWLKQDNL